MTTGIKGDIHAKRNTMLTLYLDSHGVVRRADGNDRNHAVLKSQSHNGLFQRLRRPLSAIVRIGIRILRGSREGNGPMMRAWLGEAALA
jgi:hypothetical protein